MMVTSAVASEILADDADRAAEEDAGAPWQPMLAGGLSLVTHASLFVLMAMLIPSSNERSSARAKPPMHFKLARTKLSAEPSSAESLGVDFANIAGDPIVPESVDAADASALMFGPHVTFPILAESVRSRFSESIGMPFSALPGRPMAAHPNPETSHGLRVADRGEKEVGNGSRGGTSERTVIPSGIDVAAIIREDRLRTASRKPVGEPARISLYGCEPTEGRSFVFLIDQSKSTASQGSGTLTTAETELVAALRNLQPFHRFQVIAYHDRCHYLHRREMLPATDENKQAVEPFVHGLVSQGATEHEMALMSALQHEPDVIYLLTDGGDPPLTHHQVQRISKFAGSRTAIHCVGFGYGAMPSTHAFLRDLAVTNRGGYCYVDVSKLRIP